jgi:ABC-2 type transport system ATP-binding protein
MRVNNAVIEINALSLSAKEVHILNGIKMAIPAGAVVGLVGRNGAGKSSLLRCMAGLAVPTQGTCQLLGHACQDLPDSVLERLGYVAQTPDLFEWMEVLEMLRAIGQAYPRWSEERCLSLAKRLDLPLDIKVKSLSGGDQQKLAVILALAHDPDVLLLDEPVSSLDPITRSEFMRALFVDRATDEPENTGLREARTIVISSHLLTDLERVVSHVAFIRDGRLQLLDTWDAMLEHYRQVSSAELDEKQPGILCNNPHNQQSIVDSRKLPHLTGAGRSLSLNELFVELNA